MMAHKVVPMPKKAQQYHERFPLSEKCELYSLGNDDASPCSHFDHCERKAVIWLYDRDGSPKVYGLCQQCYEWNHPTADYWYRVVKVSPEFNGKL